MASLLLASKRIARTQQLGNVNTFTFTRPRKSNSTPNHNHNEVYGSPRKRGLYRLRFRASRMPSRTPHLIATSRSHKKPAIPTPAKTQYRANNMVRLRLQGWELMMAIHKPRPRAKETMPRTREKRESLAAKLYCVSVACNAHQTSPQKSAFFSSK